MTHFYILYSLQGWCEHHAPGQELGPAAHRQVFWMAGYSSSQLLIIDQTPVVTGDFCLLIAIWFAFTDLPPSQSQPTLFRLNVPHSWAPRIHTDLVKHPSLTTVGGVGIPMRLTPKNQKRMDAKSCWGPPCRENWPERKDTQSQAILRERKRRGAKIERLEVVSRKSWALLTYKKSPEEVIPDAWAPLVSLDISVPTHPSLNYEDGNHCVPPLFPSLTCQAVLVEPTPEAGLPPSVWYSKHQISHRHWHSTTSFTHLPSQRPLAKAETPPSRQRALS